MCDRWFYKNPYSILIKLCSYRYGSWGICFTYATWFAVTGLVSAGRTLGNSATVRKACDFLLSKQLPSGGWGESYLSCHDEVTFASALSVWTISFIPLFWCLILILSLLFRVFVFVPTFFEPNNLFALVLDREVNGVKYLAKGYLYPFLSLFTNCVLPPFYAWLWKFI